MQSSMKWERETPDRLINHGDPDTITRCTNCGVYYRNGMQVEKPVKSWVWIILENWRQYRWRITVEFGGLIPLGYGLSWMEENRTATVMHPIPFNVVMRTAREFGLWLMRGGWVKFPSVQDRVDSEVAKRMLAIKDYKGDQDGGIY